MSDWQEKLKKLSKQQREEIAAQLRKGRPTLEGHDYPPRNPRDPIPLSFTQQRLWFMDQWQPDSALYNVSSALRLEGPLQVKVLEKALNALIARQASLRTNIVLHLGEPHQVIHPCLTLSLPVTECPKTGLAPQLATEAQRPFRLDSDPLIRTQLLRVDSETHILQLTLHHIITDGWSTRVLMRELSTLYTAFYQNQPAQLDTLSVQYADYSLWQRQRIQGARRQSLLTFWTERLAGVPALNLPTDHPRPAQQSYRGARYSFNLASSVVQQLRQLGQRKGVTLFVTLLAAFYTLLHRYSGQQDIAVGTPVASRGRPELENLIGFFANTLVLRTSLDNDPSFADLLARVSRVTLDAIDHQEMPFEQLVEALQPERDFSRNPLFQVMFSMQPGVLQASQWEGLRQTLLPVSTHAARFDLYVTLQQSPNGLQVMVDYATDLFTASTIARMAGHFQTLLDGIIAEPQLPLSKLPLLTRAERQQLLVAWNRTYRPLDRGVCLHQQVEAQVSQTPDAIAVGDANRTLTYAELDQQANQLAHYLRAQGVEPGMLVGLCLERSVDLAVAILAVLKAGGAYVPVDPAWPRARIATVLADAQVSLLITDHAQVQGLESGTLTILALDAIKPALASQPPDSPAIKMTAEALAYVIYTSGSTGTPKGVRIQHRAVSNFLQSMARQPGLNATDHLLSVSPFSFDMFVLELLLPLSQGARVTLAPADVARDGVQLAAALQSSGATVCQATPATWQMLLLAGWQGSASLKIISGGDVLPQAVADQLIPRCASLWNLYGPTETTVYSAVQAMRKVGQPVSIGRPIDNTQLYVLDDSLQPTPIGIPGEIWISGEGLAQGYHRRPELNTKLFTALPFFAGTRCYRSGDMARYRDDGTLEFLGRRDHQIKLRGHRIEPGEIEKSLVQHPTVRQAMVILAADTPMDQRLVAYVILSPATELDSSELRQFLSCRLPVYMLPSTFVKLDAFPVTANGKIDRQALPKPGNSHLQRSTSVLPRTPIEQLLGDIWTQVLDVKQVSIDDNFFELGGHSLLATQIVIRVREALDLQIPLKILFGGPTIRELGMAILEQLTLDAQAGSNSPAVSQSLAELEQ